MTYGLSEGDGSVAYAREMRRARFGSLAMPRERDDMVSDCDWIREQMAHLDRKFANQLTRHSALDTYHTLASLTRLNTTPHTMLRCIVTRRPFLAVRSITTAPITHTEIFPASNASSSSTSTPTHHLITLTRSPLSLPVYSSRTLAALGLRKRYQSALHSFSPSTTGRILRVKEIVRVRNVSKEEGERWMNMTRSEGSGVAVSGRVFGGGGGLSRLGDEVI